MGLPLRGLRVPWLRRRLRLPRLRLPLWRLRLPLRRLRLATCRPSRLRVKSGKAQNKQMFSGLRRKADTRGVYEVQA